MISHDYQEQDNEKVVGEKYDQGIRDRVKTFRLRNGKMVNDIET